jgi:DNA-binding LacI/PurR family transcriptional regulator
MQKKPITIKDLASMLGMSKSTVSRALRDQYDVNPETRKKVLELAQKLDFETNTLAASLRENRSYILGVIIPSFSIPFYSIALSGIHAAAAAAGYNIIVCQSDDSFENEQKNVNFLMKSRVDGILISLSRNTTSTEHLLRIAQRGVPVVMFNRVSQQNTIPRVFIDDYAGALCATRHLIEIGCRRLAHISGPSSLFLSQNRMKGFEEGLREAGLNVDPDMIVESDFTLESGKIAIQKILPYKPDALFCVCDAVAFGAMAIIKEKGLRIPEDISVAGFTNEPLSSIFSPSLTTMAQPIEEIGKAAVDLLFEHMHSLKNSHIRKDIVMSAGLIIRESTTNKTVIAQ